MELVFNTNKHLRKLVAVWDLFGPPDAPANRLDPRFFGKDFNTSAAISAEMRKYEKGDLWVAFLDKNMHESENAARFPDLRDMLTTLNIPMEDDDSKFFKEVKASLVADFKKHEEDIEVWLERIFGFKLPVEVNLVVDHYYAKNTGGSSLSSDPAIVSLRMREYANEYVGVLLHELLHSLVRKAKIFATSSMGNGSFEEALLDYFAPAGLLDWKAGLIASLDVIEHQRRCERLRPYASGNSRMLLPFIQEYSTICGEKTIWQFLKEKSII